MCRGRHPLPAGVVHRRAIGGDAGSPRYPGHPPGPRGPHPVSGAFSAAQLEAINAGDGPLILAAGAGCGKTTTLAGRIAFLIRERGVDPAAVLMLSFTTEAARRLRNEVVDTLGERAADVSILTLHALGRRVIDTWSVRLGY